MRVPLVSLISREMPMTAGIWLLLLCMNSLKARTVYVGTSVYVLQELRCGRDAAVGISLKSHKNCSTFSPADRTEKRSTMPDSPADVKTQSRLTPPTMPPPPTTQGAPRTSSFTPTACEYIKRCLLHCLWLYITLQSPCFKCSAGHHSIQPADVSLCLLADAITGFTHASWEDQWNGLLSKQCVLQPPSPMPT